MQHLDRETTIFTFYSIILFNVSQKYIKNLFLKYQTAEYGGKLNLNDSSSQLSLQQWRQ